MDDNFVVNNKALIETLKNTKVEDMKDLRIRKLTPRECLRLMAIKDEDIDKIIEHQTNANLYHLAGDSIVTTVLCAILSQFTDINWEEKFNPKEWWKK